MFSPTLAYLAPGIQICENPVPLHAARIEDLGPGDFVKVNCAACGHMALLTPAFLARLGLKASRKVLDLKDRVRCRGCGARGRAVVSIKWAKSVA